MKYDPEKLGKLVNVAKRGVGGEKSNAVRILRAICKKNGIDFDDVMSEGGVKKEYEIRYSNMVEHRIITQIVHKFSDDWDMDIYYMKHRKTIYFETTPEKYAEILVAVEVLVKLFRQEKRKVKDALFYGFLGKHDLWSQTGKKKHKESKISKREQEARELGHRMESHLGDAELIKRLHS